MNKNDASPYSPDPKNSLGSYTSS